MTIIFSRPGSGVTAAIVSGTLPNRSTLIKKLKHMDSLGLGAMGETRGVEDVELFGRFCRHFRYGTTHVEPTDMKLEHHIIGGYNRNHSRTDQLPNEPNKGYLDVLTRELTDARHIVNILTDPVSDDLDLIKSDIDRWVNATEFEVRQDYANYEQFEKACHQLFRHATDCYYDPLLLIRNEFVQRGYVTGDFR